MSVSTPDEVLSLPQPSLWLHGRSLQYANWRGKNPNATDGSAWCWHQLESDSVAFQPQAGVTEAQWRGETLVEGRPLEETSDVVLWIEREMARGTNLHPPVDNGHFFDTTIRDLKGTRLEDWLRWGLEKRSVGQTLGGVWLWGYLSLCAHKGPLHRRFLIHLLLIHLIHHRPRWFPLWAASQPLSLDTQWLLKGHKQNRHTCGSHHRDLSYQFWSSSKCLTWKEQSTQGLQHGTIPSKTSARLDSQYPRIAVICSSWMDNYSRYDFPFLSEMHWLVIPYTDLGMTDFHTTLPLTRDSEPAGVKVWVTPPA